VSGFIAALPMYDWPEVRGEVDAQWAAIRDALRASGIDAPDGLVRERTDLQALWRDPNLLLSQTCWGPMELGLAQHVQVVAQPNYSAFPGGQGELYSSVIVMRAAEAPPGRTDGGSQPIDILEGRRLAFNSTDSRSGYLALKGDLEDAGSSLSIFSELVETGGHRASIQAVAEGRADVAAIDCKTWHLAKLHEPAARPLSVVGWTTRRLGLPFITSPTTPAPVVAVLRRVLAAMEPG
jgi:ABC-type phosphate/phosphonate transport system substrate-binding protein